VFFSFFEACTKFFSHLKSMPRNPEAAYAECLIEDGFLESLNDKMV